ncbi:MAG: Spy/CpxP family protein refolding chaperone, partial [Verrucomicrobia bacterium]|nr:Spy/CpxP family protein refolding chaperone [Verrucomicrobiota bacterium]
MKTKNIILTLVFITSTCLLTAQNDNPPRDGGPGEVGSGKSEALTAVQQEQVKAILSKYDARTLTADQAKAIHEAFRQAGLRGGPQINDAVKAAGFDPDRLRDLAPPQGQGSREGGDERQVSKGQQTAAKEARGQDGRYTLEQAISDRAQLSTIAFSGLAFLTGDFGASTFIPPGKVCDYFGFQYMRDIDVAGKGHNPIFLGRVAGNVLFILNDSQRKMFQDLATEQCAQFEQLAMKRLPLIKAFHRERDGSIPQGSSGLNREAVKRYVGDIFAFDAELSYRRTEVFGKIVASLTSEQKAYLGKMKFGDFNTWPAQDEQGKLKRPAQGTSKFYNVAYMTYASEFFSWYAGSVEADVYFCPERHGTYFGGFYMKDMPAMGKRDYDISTSVTGDSGETFLTLLTAEQRQGITSIIEAQRNDLKEIIEVRSAISTELRKFLKGQAADKEKLLALGRRYGELDGEMSWMYATAFAKVNRTLTDEQRAALKKLRNLDGYTSAPAYLYSQPLQTLPNIQNTDFFFAAPGSAQIAPSSISPPAPHAQSGFLLMSPDVADGGTLPKEFTGDGASATLPLEWSGVPVGTKSFAIIMHHMDPEGKTKWYWTLYNIPADVRSLPKNVNGTGTLGNNSVNGRIEYD